jgi:glycosyltransferase involved in cell wall biosynthesis
MELKRNIIFFPAIDYQSLYQRPQHMASTLVKKGYDVYFRGVGQVSGREPLMIDGVHVYQDWDRRPKGIDDDAIFIINYPSFAGYYNWSENQFLIYDCVDDFPDFALYQEDACRKSNLIVHTTDGIKKDIQDLINDDNKQYLKIPNGVNSDYGRNSGLANELISIRSKYDVVIGFVGAMHYSWVDIEILHKIASGNPTWAIVIVGSTYTWNFTDSKAPSNLIRLGVKEYKDLATYYNGFDIGIIPFLDNQIAQGANPIKLYEYAACGIPVVSRNLSFCEGIESPILYTYNTYEECINQIYKAKSNTLDGRIKRMQFAEENTWENRVDTLLNELCDLTHLEV